MSLDTTNRITVDEGEAFDRLLFHIVARGKKYKHIAITGRGGMSVAQKVAYALDISSIYFVGTTRPKPGALFVDDIECTSATLEDVNLHYDTAVLVQRDSSKCIAAYRGITVKGDNYIDFSWEG